MKKLAFVTVILVVIASSLLYFDKFKSAANETKDVFLCVDNLNVTEFQVPEEIYLAVDESVKPDIVIEEKDGLDVKVKLESSDKKIFKVVGDEIKGKDDGKAILKVMLSSGDEKEVKVIVTSLISPYIFNNDKDFLECEKYTSSEAELLDKLLENRIKEKGYMTRAGALEAARFLLLNFKYNLNYFSENGRLMNHSNILHIDAEGRYYHKGLYLSKDKYQFIEESTEDGPVMWGCPLKGVMYKKYDDNGLNCSGFITWALFNAGYDIGDVGAGDYSYINNELLDLRPKEEITLDLLKSGKVKSGDLIGFDGHIAMIVGIDNDIIYVGESYETGTRIREFTHKELIKSDFTDIILMDDYYKEDGKYTEMW